MQTEYSLKEEDYKIGDLIIKDTSSYTFKATHIKTGDQVAIKYFINNEIFNYISEAFKVYNYFTSIDFPGTIKILGFFNQSNREILINSPIESEKKKVKLSGIAIVSELIHGTTLDKYINEYLQSKGKKPTWMNPTVRSKIIFGNASIMKKIHKSKVIFGENKLGKIILDQKKEPKYLFNQCAIFAEILKTGEYFNHGTITYMAPEKVSNDFGGTYNCSIDVYSYAYMLYTMFSNSMNFPDNKPCRSQQQFVKRIVRGNRIERPDGIPDHYWDLIQKCWSQNPTDRPTFEEIVEILKDDKYALTEFGMKTDLEELHEYQERIENSPNKIKKVKKSATPVKPAPISSKSPSEAKSISKRKSKLNMLHSSPSSSSPPSKPEDESPSLIKSESKNKSKLKMYQSSSSLSSPPPSKPKTKSKSKSGSPEFSASEIVESIWMREDKRDSYFIDDDDEKSHKVIAKIGEGATSTAYKVIDTTNDTIMCKRILKTDSKNSPKFSKVKNIIKEFEILTKINHPCICKAYFINTSEKVKDGNIDDEFAEKDQTTISLFLEFMKFDMKEVIQNYNDNNTLKTRIAIEIAHAMKFLHEHGLIHRDLKIENIMLNSVFEAKLVDFGLVKIQECFDKNYSFVDDSLSKGVGTFDYMSPEMINEEDYDNKTDVYSFGVVLFYIFIGKMPKLSLKDKTKGKLPNFPEPSSSISKFYIDLIKECMLLDPEERPSFKQIIEKMRKNHYALAAQIDQSVIYHRDHELEIFENNN